MPTPFNNYETMRDQMAGAFLRYDQEAMIRKFSLRHDADFLYICFVGREYRIDRHTGTVSWEDTDSKTVHPADYNAAMTIYDVLCCSKENCRASGEMVSIESCASVQGGSLSSQNRSFFQHAADCFDKDPAVLSVACESLGGARLARGDVAYQLNLFDFLPVSIAFWRSDEEFPASLQILVDRNILDFMHNETAMFALSHLMERLEAFCSR